MNTEDPKEKCGNKKLTLTNTPISLLALASFAMNNGVEKYGKHNWLLTKKPLDNMTYINAALRHIFLYLAGEDKASDSNICHLDHAISSLAVLRDAQLNNRVSDNRVKMTKYGLKQLKLMIEKAQSPEK